MCRRCRQRSGGMLDIRKGDAADGEVGQGGGRLPVKSVCGVLGSFVWMVKVHSRGQAPCVMLKAEGDAAVEV
jgi:hypothetical protein